MRRISTWRLLFAIAWIIWLFDYLTKVWALAVLSSEPRRVIGNFLQLTLVKNSGAAFSFATGFSLFFSLISLAVVATVSFYALKISSKAWGIAIGLLLGGVLGNLTDRLFREPGFLRGHVIDWIELPNWPVFNLADSAIVLAAVIAIVLSARNIAPIAKENHG